MIHRKTRSKERYLSPTVEQLENRRLLRADAITGEVGRGVNLDIQSFLDLIGPRNARFIPQALIDASFTSQMIPVIQAGTAAGPPPDSPANRVDQNTSPEFAGVVSTAIFHPTSGQFICSGTAISPNHILTAGHCSDISPEDGVPDAGLTATVHVNNGGNDTSLHAVSTITNHPSFIGFTAGAGTNDLSVMTLSSPLPQGTPIYALADAALAVNDTISLVGYGISGHGNVGNAVPPAIGPSFTVKRSGQNVIDAVNTDQTFTYDFDNPTTTGLPNGSLGNDIETEVAGGDSGGPSFVPECGQHAIAAVNTFELPFIFTPGTFGTFGGGISIDTYKGWINGFIGADIEITKTESIDPVVAGSGSNNLTHTVTVTNNGPAGAGAILIDESIDIPGIGVEIISITPSQGSTSGLATGTSDTSGTWDVGILANGASATLDIVFTVDETALPGTDVISDTASLCRSDSNNSNNVATESTSIVREVDIQVTKTESIDPVVAGSGSNNLTHQVTVTNNGPSNASGLVINESINIPGAGVTIVSITDSQGSHTLSTGTSDTSGTWNVGSLADGASATLTIVYTVDSSAAAGTDVISDTASLNTLNEAPDTNGSNNMVTVATSVAREVDIEVTKTESIDPVVAGSGSNNLTHQVTVTNNGPSNASGVVIDESINIPGAGVTIVSITDSQGSHTLSTGTSDTSGTWNVGSLADGASATLTIVYTVDSSAAAGTDVISDTASLNTLNEAPDTNGSNNMVTVATSVAREVDIEVTKTESIDPVVAGSGSNNLTHTVTVTNDGVSDASGVVIDESIDIPASGVTIVSITESQGSHNLSTGTSDTSGTWNVGSLADGASATLTIVYTVDGSAAAGTDVISDTASLNTLNEAPDTNGSNNMVTVATSISSKPILRIKGGTWVVDALVLDEGQNPVLPFSNLNTAELVFGSPQTTPPTLTLLGPTDGAPPISTTLVGWTSGDQVATFTFATLEDGFYRIMAEGMTYDFGVLHGDTNGDTEVGTFVVNIFDYLLLVDNWDPGASIGSTPSFLDYNGDSFVNIFDFLILQGSYLDDLNGFTPPGTPMPALSLAAMFALPSAVAVDGFFGNDDEEDE